MRKWLLPAVATVLVFTVTACQNHSVGGSRSGTNYGSVKGCDLVDGPRAYGSQFPGDGPVVHEVTQLSYNQKLSDEISALPGVNTALVMRTDRNAYIALLLDETATGTKGGAGWHHEVNNSGQSINQYNGHNFTQGLDGNLLTSGFNNYDTEEHHDDLSHGLKQTVALKIRNLDPTVHDVFITANRDFINQTYMYAQEAWKGNSLDPYVPDFKRAVNAHFANRETGANPNEVNRPK